MAHALSVRSGGDVELKYNVQGGVPWHGLGKASNGLMTVADAFAGTLDWNAIKVPLAAQEFTLRNGVLVPAQPYGDVYAVARDDNGKLIGQCGRVFQIYQNSELQSFVDALAGGKRVVETIGSIFDGQRVWVLLKLQEISVHGKDAIKNYLLVSNSFKAGTAILIALVNMRVVCANTYASAITEVENDRRRSKRAGEPLSFRIVHSSSAGEQLEAAAEALGVATMKIRETSKLFEALAKKSVSEALAKEFFAKVYAAAGGRSAASKARTLQGVARANLAEQLFNTGRGADIFPGTAYNLFQAVTDVEDHSQGRRKPEGQMAYALFDQGARYKERALAFASALLK